MFNSSDKIEFDGMTEDGPLYFGIKAELKQ